jgi:sporulation protein YlmC with PRC-barrel domain
MKYSTILLLTTSVLLTPAIAMANNPAVVVGVQPISATELSHLVTGWSAKKQILGKTVFNDKNQKIGVIDDIVIGPEKTVSYAIIGAGGFLGVGKHDVAISINHFEQRGEKFVIVGITKETLKNAPEFKYAETH